MKKIIYLGNFSFPHGNAAGKRVYANGKAFKEIDYETIFIGTDHNISNENLKLSNTNESFDGFEYYNFAYPKSGLSWLKYKKTFKMFKKFIEEDIGLNNIEMVIFYGSPSLSLFISEIIQYCRSNKITVISDCVDWLTVKTSNPLFNIVKYIDTAYQKVHLNCQVDGLITISSYLENYYKDKGMITVTVPPLTPTINKKIIINNHSYKHIVYAGIPFRKGEQIKDINTLKDRVDKIIIMLNEVSKRGGDFKLSIYGFTRQEYLTAIPSQKKYVEGLGDKLIFRGMRPNSEVTEVIKKADFTVLFRDKTRDTMAGFPTKVSESISFGTPVITTKTSDLNNYIIDGKYGFFIDLTNKDIALNKLTQVINMKKNSIMAMKKECLNSELFSYYRYTEKINDFFKKI